MPAGIADGQRIRLAGRGHAGEADAPAGDLYVLVRVREDKRFVREGDDLITALDVPAPLAALGGTLEVPTLEGTASVELRSGHATGRGAHAAGRGHARRCGRGRRGDLQVVVNVVIPRRLSDEQRELLEQLNEHAHRGEPALGGVDVRQAASRVGQPGGVIRLAVRVRRAQAEIVLAELLELAPAGVEEVELEGEDTVEYAVYGAPGELPALPDLRGGGWATRSSRSPPARRPTTGRSAGSAFIARS